MSARYGIVVSKAGVAVRLPGVYSTEKMARIAVDLLALLRPDVRFEIVKSREGEELELS